jgi:hypothetical protein
MPTVYSPTLSSWQAESAIGPIVPRSDFPDTTEITTISQRYTITAASYAPPTIGTATAYAAASYYLTGDVGFGNNGQMLEFTREWSRIPSDRTIYDSRPIEHPGREEISGGETRIYPPRTLFTQARTTFRYYLAASAPSLTLTQQFRVTVTVSSVAVDTGMILTADTFPTAASYAAEVTAGGFTKTLEDNYAQWRGNLVERQTVEYTPL